MGTIETTELTEGQKKLVDKVMKEIGEQADMINRGKGIFAMQGFINKWIDQNLSRINDESIINSLSPIQKEMREKISRDLQERIRNPIARTNPHLSPEEEAKLEWNKSADLRSEFFSFEGFLAYKRAEASGQVKISRGISVR